MKKVFYFTLFLLPLLGCKEQKKEVANTAKVLKAPSADEKSDSVTITPIAHATAVIHYGDLTLYIDPVGGAEAFEGQKAADIILVTDIHGDHLSAETLAALDTQNATVLVPQAVADQLGDSTPLPLQIINNGERAQLKGIEITAIPMYNLREEAKKFHPKGRGNGYVLDLGGERLYFSGDTEDIPEMRALEDIDKAFVCMNLPYTMTVDSAADAVLEFKPKQVYPYHYRGNPDVSDVSRFKELVETGDANIEVVQLDWYPNADY